MACALDQFIWNHPESATALYTLFMLFFQVLLGGLTLFYLISYTTQTKKLRVEASRQSSIQTEAYEASDMPLLVPEFSLLRLGGDFSIDAVILRNIGNGPALGVKFAPLENASGPEIQFDYIVVIAPGGSAPLVCLKGTPKPPEYSDEERGKDESDPDGMLYKYARSYLLRCDQTTKLKVTATSLSNAVHEFFSAVHVRGSDNSAVFTYLKRKRVGGAGELS